MYAFVPLLLLFLLFSRSRFPSKRIFRSNVFVCDRFYSPAAAQAAIVKSEKRRKNRIVSRFFSFSISLFPLKKEKKKSSYVFFAYFLSSLYTRRKTQRERSIALCLSLPLSLSLCCSLLESMRHVYVEHVYTRDRQ